MSDTRRQIMPGYRWEIIDKKTKNKKMAYTALNYGNPVLLRFDRFSDVDDAFIDYTRIYLIDWSLFLADIENCGEDKYVKFYDDRLSVVAETLKELKMDEVVAELAMRGMI